MNEETGRETKLKENRGRKSALVGREQELWTEKELGQIWASSETGHFPISAPC